MRHRLLPLVAALSILAAACGGGDGDTGDAGPGASTSSSTSSSTSTPASSSSTTTTTSLAPAPVEEYVERGPHPVGRRATVIVDAARDRALPLEILYPAVDDGAQHTFYELLPGLGYESDSALDAPPVAEPPADSPGWPLVVYSHGSSGFGWVHADFTEHLASYGFVVVAPDHVGNTLLDSLMGEHGDLEGNVTDRPSDVSFAITATLAGLSEPLAEVGALVDRERIGVVGHSAGAFAGFAAVAGRDDVDPDGRIDAVVGFAPATRGLDDAELSAVGVPTLLVSGTADLTTPIETNTERPFELIAGRPLVRVDIVDAGHLTFTDICRFVELLETLPAATDLILEVADSYAAEACVPELIDIDVAQDTINHTATAFLLDQVAGDESASESISERGIEQVAGENAIHLSR